MWTKERITELLKANDFAVERAIIVLYRRQTDDERREAETKHHNGVGFSAAHARIGTRWAQWLLRDKNNHLSHSHLASARKISLKYVNQLVEQANLNQERKQNV